MSTESDAAGGAAAKRRGVWALLLASTFVGAVYLLSAQLDVFERFFTFSRRYESWDIDELLAVGVALLFVVTLLSLRQWRRLRQTRKDLLTKNESLQEAFAEIKQLRGIIPICSSCKKIRDEAGAWHQVEIYVKEHTEAQFSHGLCPDCLSKMYSGPYPKYRERGGETPEP